MKHAIGNKTLGMRNGTAMLEFALVLPIFVLLLMGIVEFSRVLMVKQVITNAAREGARAGSIYFDEAVAIAKAEDVSHNYIVATGVDLEPVTIDAQPTTNNGNPALQVVISYNYDSLLTGWIPGLPATLALSATAIMRREA